MIINGKRALAYIVAIDGISKIEGADNIELAQVGGWNVIVKKTEFKPGDYGVFFEIDSKLPEAEWSEFLRPKHFKVKTYKLGKFKVISQGLVLPFKAFESTEHYEKLRKMKLNEDVTELLGITYAVEEDNARKSNNVDKEQKYNRMAARHPKLAKQGWFKWLMQRDWGRKLLFIFFGKKKDNPKTFPDWIKRTDEERVENMKWILTNKEPWIVTEKIDGTSTTVFLDLSKRNEEFGVCSRNVRQVDINQINYHSSEIEGNVYWEMALKYDMKNALKHISKQYPDVKRIVLQGETYGANLQGNPYKLTDRRFAAFNLILDGERLGSLSAKAILESVDIPFVPIIDADYILPDDFEEFKLSADGWSIISPAHRREGYVYRSHDGKQSFKNVSREFLLRK